PVSAAAAQVLPWLRYVSPGDPQRVKNTPAVANLTCLATKGLKSPRDESDEICRLTEIAIEIDFDMDCILSVNLNLPFGNWPPSIHNPW
ncbi:MAG: hypothetical protein ABGX16_06380, partial [Pirellulales bacterium]